MMNQNISRVFIAAVAVALVFPLSFAEAYIPIKNIDFIGSKLGEPPVKKQPKNTEEFCSKFTETAGAIGTNITKQKTKVLGFLNERKDASKEGRDTRDAVLKTNREKADQKRSDWYKRLEDKADTDAKKNAVLLFKQTVDSAVDVRQTAVDTAIESFRKGVDDAIVARDSSMQGTGSAFVSAVDAAVAKVKTDCDNGSTTGAIRANFRGNLGNAREALKIDKKSTDKVGAQVKALALTRQETVKKSIARFEMTRNATIADLKKAFGE